MLPQLSIAEYRTYQKNPDKDIKWASVDNVRVFKFLDEVYALPNNNQIHGFESAQDIITCLREQWSGLFQRFLQEQEAKKQAHMVERMEGMINTLGQMVGVLSEKQAVANEAVTTIIALNHPLFHRMKSALNITYPIYFTNIDEINAFLTSLLFTSTNSPYGPPPDPDYHEWEDNEHTSLRIAREIFTESGGLKRLTDADWHEEYFKHQSPTPDFGGYGSGGYGGYDSRPSRAGAIGEDIPF